MCYPKKQREEKKELLRTIEGLSPEEDLASMGSPNLEKDNGLEKKPMVVTK